jgi:hypothetical protein
MASVYSQAYLVIGASRARNSREGYMVSTCSRPAVHVATVENVDESLSNIYAREHNPHGDVCSPFSRSAIRGPLASRGWTLQEQLLSCRMVHFEDEEMFWECRSSTSCECLELTNASSYKTRMETVATTGSFRTWHAVVEQYHRRSLSYATDFLPGLSGVAAYLQKLGTGDYIAGLWKADIVDELLWHVTSGNSTRAEPYRAPSWSWASISKLNSITFSSDWDDPCVPLCRILRVDCQPAGLDPNGAVASGFIKLEAKVLRLERKQTNGGRSSGRDKGSYLWPTEFSTGFLETFNDVASDASDGLGLYVLLVGRLVAYRRSRVTQNHWRRDFTSSDLDRDSGWMACIHALLQCLWPAGASVAEEDENRPLLRRDHTAGIYRGLLIRKLDDHSDTYERVGLWSLQTTMPDDPTAPNFLGQMSDSVVVIV